MEAKYVYDLICSVLKEEKCKDAVKKLNSITGKDFKKIENSKENLIKLFEQKNEIKPQKNSLQSGFKDVSKVTKAQPMVDSSDSSDSDEDNIGIHTQKSQIKTTETKNPIENKPKSNFTAQKLLDSSDNSSDSDDESTDFTSLVPKVTKQPTSVVQSPKIVAKKQKSSDGNESSSEKDKKSKPKVGVTSTAGSIPTVKKSNAFMQSAKSSTPNLKKSINAKTTNSSDDSDSDDKENNTSIDTNKTNSFSENPPFKFQPKMKTTPNEKQTATSIFNKADQKKMMLESSSDDDSSAEEMAVQKPKKNTSVTKSEKETKSTTLKPEQGSFKNLAKSVSPKKKTEAKMQMDISDSEDQVNSIPQVELKSKNDKTKSVSPKQNLKNKTIESSDDSSSSDEEMNVELTKINTKVKGSGEKTKEDTQKKVANDKTGKKLASVVPFSFSDDSSDEDISHQQKTPDLKNKKQSVVVKTPQKTPTQPFNLKGISDSDSSSDEDEVALPVGKKTSFSSSENSFQKQDKSSKRKLDETTSIKESQGQIPTKKQMINKTKNTKDDDVTNKNKPCPAVLPKVTPSFDSSSDSSSSDDEEILSKSKNSSMLSNSKLNNSSNNSSLNSSQTIKKNTSLSNISASSNHKNMTNEPFRRVSLNALEENPELRNVSQYKGDQSDYGFKAHMAFSNVKGQKYKSEKTKKKRSSSSGGTITTMVNSHKFSSSDEE